MYCRYSIWIVNYTLLRFRKINPIHGTLYYNDIQHTIAWNSSLVKKKKKKKSSDTLLTKNNEKLNKIIIIINNILIGNISTFIMMCKIFSYIISSMRRHIFIVTTFLTNTLRRPDKSATRNIFARKALQTSPLILYAVTYFTSDVWAQVPSHHLHHRDRVGYLQKSHVIRYQNNAIYSLSHECVKAIKI